MKTSNQPSTSKSKLNKSVALAAMALMMAAAVTILASNASAQVSQDLESLGSNKDIVTRANRLESRSRISIVQNRTVKRDWRVELGAAYGPVAAGDSYLNTQNLGLNADLHITPKVSLGVHYAKAFNSLTNEGKSRFEAARAAKARNSVDYKIPDIDYPEDSVLGVLNWYMTYGKINMFDISVVQFDIYSLVGAGTVRLSSGNATTWTAGGGIGFWLNQHMSARFEVRYQNYSDKVYDGSRNLNLVVGTLGLGVLL